MNNFFTSINNFFANLTSSLGSRTKRVLFWAGIIIFFSALIFFFWAKFSGVAPAGDKESDKSDVQERKNQSSSQNSQSNKPALSSVKFFEQSKQKDDNTLLVLAIFLIGGGLIGYAIYANKDNMV
jgi:hypothetical protein